MPKTHWVNVVLALAMQALQTTPYIVTSSLLAKHKPLPVLGMMMIIAAVTLVVCKLPSIGAASLRRPAAENVDDQKLIPTGLVALYLGLACLEWGLLFWMIGEYGPTATIVVILASGIGTLWMGWAIFKSEPHRPSSIGKLAGATSVLLVASALFARDKLLAFEWAAVQPSAPLAAAPVMFAVAVEVALNVVRILVSDRDEARLLRRRAIAPETLVALQLVTVAAAIAAANITVDGGQQMLALVPDSVDPRTWTLDHFGLLWVSVVNTSFGVLAQAKLTNRIGMPIATAVGQSKPLLSELMQASWKLATPPASSLIDMIGATALLIWVAMLVQRRAPQK